MKRRFLLIVFMPCLLLSVSAAADRDWDSADFEKGVVAFEAGDYKAAYREFMPLALQGDGHAQFNVALMFHRGLGVRQNYEKASLFYAKAGNQGVAEALDNLGLMFVNGEGKKKNHSSASRFFIRASELGFAKSQHNLATMLYEGDGVPQDYVYAHMWWNIASSQGFDGASDSRDRVAQEMTPDQIAEAQKLARECVKKEYKNC